MKIRSDVVAGDGIGIDPNGGPPARPRTRPRPRPLGFRTGGGTMAG